MAESREVARAFADCHDYNQKVDVAVYLLTRLASDADGKAAQDWLVDQKNVPAGTRVAGGPHDEEGPPAGPVTTRIETKRDADRVKAEAKEAEKAAS